MCVAQAEEGQKQPTEESCSYMGASTWDRPDSQGEAPASSAFKENFGSSPQSDVSRRGPSRHPGAPSGVPGGHVRLDALGLIDSHSLSVQQGFQG